MCFKSLKVNKSNVKIKWASNKVCTYLSLWSNNGTLVNDWLWVCQLNWRLLLHSDLSLWLVNLLERIDDDQAGSGLRKAWNLVALSDN